MNTAVNAWWDNFYEELKRRRVIRVGTLYVVVFWPIIQIVDILSPALELTPATMRYLLIGFVAGLPLALILSWLFDFNKGGVVRAGHTGELTGRCESSTDTRIFSPMLAGFCYIFQ